MSSVPNISARTYCDDMSSVMMNMFLRLLKLQTQQPGEVEFNKHLPEVLREFRRDSRFSEELLPVGRGDPSYSSNDAGLS